MVLVIAEKPQAAEHIAVNRGAKNRKDGYWEGNGYRITYAYGHLIELCMPEHYDEKYKTWEIEDLPILPAFQYKVNDEGYRRKQFGIIKKLLGEASTVVNGCDNDREGENIFRLIMRMCGYTDMSNVKRVLYSDFNDKSLNKAFSDLRPATDFENLFRSAEARQKADWLYGINLTRLLTCSAKSGKWAYGRVMTPTLMLVCDAYIENDRFVETPFWKTRVTLKKEDIIFTATNTLQFKDKRLAEESFQSIPKELSCTKKTINDRIEAAPKLFSLSELQQVANAAFGLKPHETLEAAQNLYEKYKLTTYPRSDSRYLPQAMESDVMEVLEVIQKGPTVFQEFKNAADDLLQSELNRGPFNDSKVGSHHAIIPTSESFQGKTLNTHERIVYSLIVRQFLQALMKDCEKKVTHLEFAFKTDVFSAVGTEIIKKGWRVLDETLDLLKGREAIKEGVEQEREESQRLPSVNEEESLPVIGKEILEKKTQKPPLLTGATLIKAMINAGKKVEDETLAEAMKKDGIGTEATRGQTILKLYQDGYIADKGKAIVPTQDGLQLYMLLKHYKIASPILTGMFESKLSEIEDGTYEAKSFLDNSVRIMLEHMNLLKTTAEVLESKQKEKISIGIKCPICKDGEVVEGINSYHCTKSSWKKNEKEWINEGCTFQVTKKILGKKLSGPVIVELLTDGKTKKAIKGFKKDKEFSARLKMGADYKIQFDFTESEEDRTSCPKCKTGSIRFFEKAASCSNKEKCDFVIFRNILGKNISEKNIRELITKKKSTVIKGFKTKEGKVFDAALVLGDDFKAKFEKSK